MIKSSLFADQERNAKLNKLGVARRRMKQLPWRQWLIMRPRPSRERGGAPPFPTESMVRMLLIQQLFNLSDEQMEFQLLNRLRFGSQRFVGLRSDSQIPNRTTIWPFSERLIHANASASIFEAVNKTLSTHGDIACGGQLINASYLKEAQVEAF